jgi:hypothetical protein
MSAAEGMLVNTPTMEIMASGDKDIVGDDIPLGDAVKLEEPEAQGQIAWIRSSEASFI